MRFLLFPFILFSSLCLAESFPVITPEQFQIGSVWTWAYSEIDGQTGQAMAPYLYESYRVVAKEGHEVHIEMSSSPRPDLSMPAHHLFIADVSACSANRKMRPSRSWFIQFYTKSLGDHEHWELVSKQYDGSAFEEKFNCYEKSPSLQSETGSASFRGQDLELFHFKNTQPSGWYVKTQSPLRGVVFSKKFPGKTVYVLQLFDFSSNSSHSRNL